MIGIQLSPNKMFQDKIIKIYQFSIKNKYKKEI